MRLQLALSLALRALWRQVIPLLLIMLDWRIRPGLEGLWWIQRIGRLLLRSGRWQLFST